MLNEYLQQRLAIKNGRPPVEKRKQELIAKVSEKRKLENKEYRKIVKGFAKIDIRCKVKSPVCTGEMQGMNHKQKRSPANLLVEANLTPCCNACNQFLEEHTDWARNNGHLISRFKK